MAASAMGCNFENAEHRIWSLIWYLCDTTVLMHVLIENRERGGISQFRLNYWKFKKRVYLTKIYQGIKSNICRFSGISDDLIATQRRKESLLLNAPCRFSLLFQRKAFFLVYQLKLVFNGFLIKIWKWHKVIFYWHW